MGSRVVLIVDDEEAFLLSLEDGLDLGDDVRLLTAKSGDEALEIMAREHVDLVVTDLRMPGMDGLELIERVERLYEGVAVVAMSAVSVASADDRLRWCVRFLEKPVDLDDMGDAIRTLLPAS